MLIELNNIYVLNPYSNSEQLVWKSYKRYYTVDLVMQYIYKFLILLYNIVFAKLSRVSNYSARNLLHY